MGQKHTTFKKSQRRGHAQKIKGRIIMNQTSLDIPQLEEEKTRFKMEKMMEKYKMRSYKRRKTFFQRAQQLIRLHHRVFRTNSTQHRRSSS